jgi:citrate lyase subunit beta/citryl-CoA lyase
MSNVLSEAEKLVRRSSLYVPVNREKFVAKAWERGADSIILDLEDSIAPADKTSARKMVKDVIPIVSKGGAEISVRINRDFAAEDLDAVVVPGLHLIVIPKSETAEEIQQLDRVVTRLEKERALPLGKIQFGPLIESALGVFNVENIAKSSPRIVQIGIGQGDLSIDMGFTRAPELNFEQYVYAENKLIYAARIARIQARGLGAQNVHFTSISMNEEAMLKACRHAYQMGYRGMGIIHPAWIKPANEGFKPSEEELDRASKVKAALEEAYAQGKGSVAVDGRMYDVANMKYINRILDQAEAVDRREAEKAAAVAVAKGIC